METLAPALSQVIDATGLRKRLILGMAPLVWKETVGDSIARHTRVDRVKNGIVYVCTDNPVWAQELIFLKTRIIEQLNDKLGEPVVQDIRFRTGRKIDEKTSRATALRPGRKELEQLELPERTLEKAVDLVAPIPDDELRQRVAAWSVQVLKLREWEKRHPLRKCTACGKPYRSRRKKCPHCAEEE